MQTALYSVKGPDPFQPWGHNIFQAPLSKIKINPINMFYERIDNSIKIKIRKFSLLESSDLKITRKENWKRPIGSEIKSIPFRNYVEHSISFQTFLYRHLNLS